jgi:hypothetical protein
MVITIVHHSRDHLGPSFFLGFLGESGNVLCSLTPDFLIGEKRMLNISAVSIKLYLAIAG